MASGKVKFTFIENNKNDYKSKVIFLEKMQYSFNRVVNDFAGWLTHIMRLETIFNDKEAQKIEDLVFPNEEKIRDLIKELK